MRIIKKHLSLSRFLLIAGVAVIALPIASRIRATATTMVKEPAAWPARQATADDGDADARAANDGEATTAASAARPQDDYYERRREYWDKRVERRLERRDEYLDETGDKDEPDAKDNKATKDKASKDDDEEDDEDNVDKDLEKRREYWRKRLDKEW